MTQQENLTQPGRSLKEFFVVQRDRLQQWWQRLDEKHGDYIYGVMALAAIGLFLLVVHLLKGMVQFI